MSKKHCCDSANDEMEFVQVQLYVWEDIYCLAKRSLSKTSTSMCHYACVLNTYFSSTYSSPEG